MGAFFSTVANAAHRKADMLRQQAHEANQGQIEVYKGVLANPNSTPDQRQFAADSLNKLYAIKPADSPFHKVLGVLNHVGQKLQPPANPTNTWGAPTTPTATTPSQPNELDSQAAPQTNELGDSIGGGVSPPQPKSLPPISFDPGGAGGATSSPDQATNLTGAGSDTVHPSLGRRILGGVGKGLSTIAGGVQSGLSALTEPTGLSPTVPIDASQIPAPGMGPVKWDTGMVPGSAVVNEGADRYGNPIDPKQNYHVGIQNGRRVLQPAAVNANARPVALHPISVTDAQSMANQGHEFLDLKGDPIDPKSLDKTMQVVPVALPGGKIAYTVTSQGQTHFTVGNEVYAVPQMEQTNLGSTGVDLGRGRVSTTRSAPGLNPITGEMGITTTTSTPATTGVNSPRSLPPVTPGQQTSGVQRSPTGTGKSLSPLPAPAVAPPARSSAASSGGAIPFSAAHQIQQQIIPVREAMTQVFGDPTMPELDTLPAYAHIADNKASRERVGNAVKTTLDRMGQEAQLDGGLIQALENRGGLTAWKTQAANDVLQNQFKDMTPEERKAYNATIAAYSAIIGIRSLTRASAAKFSATALENELPIPGLNTMSKEDYYDKLARIGEQVYNGTKIIPFSAEDKDYVKGHLQQLLKLSKGGVSAPDKNGTKMETKVYQGHTYERPVGSSDAWHLQQQ